MKEIDKRLNEIRAELRKNMVKTRGGWHSLEATGKKYGVGLQGIKRLLKLKASSNG